MDTTELRSVYDGLADVASAGPFNSPPPEEWPMEHVVAHAIATNRTLVWLGMQLLDGRDTSYEGGTLTVEPAWLESIVESAGDHASLITALRQSYAELIALGRRFDDTTANLPFPAVIYDGRGKVLFQGPLTFERLVLKFLTGHMRQHTHQIKALASVAISSS